MSLSTTASRKRALIIATALSTSLSLAAPTFARAADQPGLAIELVNGSVRLLPSDGRWEAFLNIRNLTDERYFGQKTNI
jgi:outer membrane receptor protein involved in Fe transport